MRIVIVLAVLLAAPLVHAEAGVPTDFGVLCEDAQCVCGGVTCRCGEVCAFGRCVSNQGAFCVSDNQCSALRCGSRVCVNNVCVVGGAGGGSAGGGSAGGGNSGGGNAGSSAGSRDGGPLTTLDGGSVIGPLAPIGCGCGGGNALVPALVLLLLAVKRRAGW
ncbi:MAG: hypothetical protein MUC96_22205 [Myxococcaceae bacterium]|jgi:hypothetical protein|nr:hypothetical protein [Myxococcaceae bacterium]